MGKPTKSARDQIAQEEQLRRRAVQEEQLRRRVTQEEGSSGRAVQEEQFSLQLHMKPTGSNSGYCINVFRVSITLLPLAFLPHTAASNFLKRNEFHLKLIKHLFCCWASLLTSFPLPPFIIQSNGREGGLKMTLRKHSLDQHNDNFHSDCWLVREVYLPWQIIFCVLANKESVGWKKKGITLTCMRRPAHFQVARLFVHSGL